MTATIGTSSARLGRKIHRPSGAPRNPACNSCAQRRVKCDGGSPCQACLRLAAWKGHPPPLECAYTDSQHVPARRNGPLSPALAAYGNIQASISSDVSPPVVAAPSLAPSSATNSTGRKCRRSGGPALQKGLACLACKSRRIRCDGTKPACGACTRRQKRAGVTCETSTCVYRADLYLMTQEGQYSGERPLSSDPELLRDDAKLEAVKVQTDVETVVAEANIPPARGDESSATAENGNGAFRIGRRRSLAEETSSLIPPSSTVIASLETALPATSPKPTLLPARLPPLPPALPPLLPLSSTPIPSTSATGFPLYSPCPTDPPSYFTSISPRSSSFSSSSTVTPSDLDLDDLLSSCSSWSSPSTPLDAFSFLHRRNYPPVPYPSSLDYGGTGINPLWMDACALNVPPLKLSALALYPWPEPTEGVCSGDEAGQFAETGPEPHVKQCDTVGDVMLTLPLEPAFASEWDRPAAVGVATTTAGPVGSVGQNDLQ